MSQFSNWNTLILILQVIIFLYFILEEILKINLEIKV